MKYYRHSSIAIVVRISEGFYEFASWGHPYWYREEGNYFDSHSRDSYYEIPEEEAEAFVKEALRAEREAEEQAFAEEFGFDSYGELMEFAEETNSGIIVRPIQSGRWMAWRNNYLDPEDVVFGDSRDEVLAIVTKN